MVMQINTTTASNNGFVFANRHTGQDSTRNQSRIQLRHVRVREDNRIRRPAVDCQIEIDVDLLTGDLDQDITILNIVA